MNRSQILGGFFLCLIASPSFAEGKSPINFFVGKWTVTDVIGYSEISGGVPEAKRLLGKILSISKNRIDFDDESCAPSDGFTFSMVDAESKFSEDYGKFYIPELGLPKRMLVMDSSKCISVYKSSDYSGAFGWNGVILRAYK